MRDSDPSSDGISQKFGLGASVVDSCSVAVDGGTARWPAGVALIYPGRQRPLHQQASARRCRSATACLGRWVPIKRYSVHAACDWLSDNPALWEGRSRDDSSSPSPQAMPPRRHYWPTAGGGLHGPVFILQDAANPHGLVSPLTDDPPGRSPSCLRISHFLLLSAGPTSAGGTHPRGAASDLRF